mmetsp:Transcript_61331/g.176486  ORF Transcript_61331/g.176486 Transcript_61331/m.176486 type:complete len:251 (+) Transcript_61331:535-1287(+)
MKTPTSSGVRLHAARKAAHLAANASMPPSRDSAATSSVRSPKRRTTSATDFACSTEAWRLDLAKMTPMRLAPAATAQRASSGRTTPQTLTTTAPGATGNAGELASSRLPMSSRMAAPGSGARIKASPMRTPLQEIARHSATSSAVAKPLSAKTLVACPAPKAMFRALSSSVICAVRFLSSSNVCKLRLFTPMILAPASKATLSSREVTTSTKGSMPQARQQAMSARSRVCERIDTMSNAVSAPLATASKT